MGATNLIYLNGELVPEAEAKVSIFDIGFMYSAVFMEALRTFRHELFRLEDHLDRLECSMRYCGLPPLVSREEMAQAIRTVVEANIAAIPEDDDCWICAQVTPGQGFPHPMMKGHHSPPTVMAYVSYLPYDEYCDCYDAGKPAIVATTRNVPPAVVDPRGKTRYRLHYFMAKLEAQTRDSHAFALLLDTDGFVTEGTGANFFIARDGVLYTPTTRNVLEGISRRVVIELAQEQGIPVVERDLTLYDVYSADEAFWTTSSYCMLPCSRVNHMAFEQTPGPLFTQLIAAWSNAVGVDIIGQARKYRSRESNVWRA
ncbi:aminotransferase class IV [bacterium]|nr:aminotransferase class IV [bacterium]